MVDTKGAKEKPKVKYLQVRLTDEDEAIIGQLTNLYHIERSALVRFALNHVLETRPTFKTIHAPRQ